MARSLPALEIFTSILELLQGQLGTYRRLDPGIFAPARFVDLDRAGKQQVAMSLVDSARNGFEVALSPMGDNDASPPGALYEQVIKNLAVVIRIITPANETACDCQVTFGEPQDLAVTLARYEALAQQLSDLEDAVQALRTSENLSNTQGGQSTGIIDGMLFGLTGVASPEITQFKPDWESKFIEAQITARAAVLITQNS